ncbi:MAG: lipoate protein ligase C-terminal domain-containing protein [archaeon]
MKKIILKKPGMKLLKLSLEEERGIIKKIAIKGDFFIYSEESIEKIEEFLVGKKISENLATQLNDFFKKNKIECVGISAEVIAEGILSAK